MKNIIIGAIAFLASCAAAQAQNWTGKASYYRGRGRMTCAHRSLPFGTHVRVTNLSNNRSAVLVVNDRIVAAVQTPAHATVVAESLEPRLALEDMTVGPASIGSGCAGT